MSDATRWDDYFARVERYLETGKIESEELNYKRETAQELARYREELLSRPKPISIKSNDNLTNLGGYYSIPPLLRWLGTDVGTDAVRKLWAPYERLPGKALPVDDAIARIRAFSEQLPRDLEGRDWRGAGTRMRPISVLLMALDVEQYPPFKTTEFTKTYRQMAFPEPSKRADDAALYEHAIRFLDRFIEEAKERGLDMPSTRLEAQSLVWALATGRDSPAPEGDEEDRNDGESPDPHWGAPQPASSLSALADRLLLPHDFLTEIETLLDDKRQVIFQGPPGTGKTYVARELAACLAGATERVRLVQFHPSYAYEDFVQGFRPTLRDGQPGFELRNGPLVEVAEQAKREPDARHFLVIDEINRGNLAKVFGELYFLLEYRDSELRLLYSDTPFALPDNLFIIGTMNTADRSIALVDLALRRRFHFVEFHPDRPPVDELLGRWLERNAPDMRWVADLVDHANEILDDRQAAIGPSYFMKPGLDGDKLRLIWEHAVLPYVEEHLYGAHDRLDEFDLDRLRREIDGRAAAQDGDGGGNGGAPNDAGN